MHIIEKILQKLGLFWQYPVITEKVFYQQNMNDPNYFPFPWATIIDKRINLQRLYQILIKIIPPNRNYYTCCQHIYFENFFIKTNFWKSLGIIKAYVPHKRIGQDKIGNIELVACPLYAVNIEDPIRNNIFKEMKLINRTRLYLYSFIGGYDAKCYLTDIRLRIFDLNKTHRPDCIIRNTGTWHFNCDVYGGGQEQSGKLNEDELHKIKTKFYNSVILDSRYVLAPSGSGPNSIRFWEALAVGSIPILLTDTLELPKHDLWDKAIVRIKESDIGLLDDVLSKISKEEEQERRKNCIKLYRHFRNNYKNDKLERIIIHYCCGSYYRGSVGGVARYDYHISKAFPNYKHFTGPQQKNELLQFLKKCKNPIVITDNHLSCDIPNDYETILVHHGCAMTTSERNPDWGEPWKSLCTNGQLKMLDYRSPKNTTILSISQACTDDFTKYFGEKYTKFERIDMLHASELDENRYKTLFNTIPQVLGNWRGLKKGQRLMPHLMKNAKDFKFNQLNISIRDGDINDFNKRKQDIYLNNDIFLQLSNSEGNSYASLDALICGMVVVSSDVGLFYKDIPEDCFVKLDWRKNGDVEYVESKLRYAWEHREVLSKNGREWYLKNCGFKDWTNKIKDLVYN